jgi:hypothetical protein
MYEPGTVVAHVAAYCPVEVHSVLPMLALTASAAPGGPAMDVLENSHPRLPPAGAGTALPYLSLSWMLNTIGARVVGREGKEGPSAQ